MRGPWLSFGLLTQFSSGEDIVGALEDGKKCDTTVQLSIWGRNKLSMRTGVRNHAALFTTWVEVSVYM
jgi:hypothetical protein